MFSTTSRTAVVSSSQVQRKYSDVIALLNQNKAVFVTNKNNLEGVDGIFIPYSKNIVSLIEDLLEDIEMATHKTSIEKKVAESYKSYEKEGGISLDEL